MNSYLVFASPKPGVDTNELEKRMEIFLKEQVRDNLLAGYRVMRIKDNANFPEMPTYQIICDYENEEDLKKAFEHMRPDRWKAGTHASVMSLVEGIRVSFSEGVSQQA